MAQRRPTPTPTPRSTAELRMHLVCVLTTLFHRAQHGRLHPEEERVARHAEEALEALERLEGARPSSAMVEAALLNGA